MAGQVDAGRVNVIYGSPSGLAVPGNQFWNQGSNGILDVAEAFDNFGYGLAPGTGKARRK